MLVSEFLVLLKQILLSFYCFCIYQYSLAIYKAPIWVFFSYL